jgi:hypothetical protein
VAESSLPVEHLFTLTAKVEGPAATGGGPQGARLIFNAPSGTVEGPRVRGTIESPGGDWATARPDGSLKLDVRATLRTHDGAVILVSYNGIAVQREGRLEIRTAPLFETGDARYAWLNDVQAVGIGTTVPGGVRYEVYALR